MSGTSSAVWVCVVCGYVHRGDKPPAECPVCGASSDAFELQETSKSPLPSAENVLRCVVCGYVHKGVEAPQECPLCGAPSNAFERKDESAETPKKPAVQRGTLVIVGAGVAGVSAAESARQHAPDMRIVLISDEAALPYYRLNLSRYLAGQISPEQLPLHPEEWYAQNRIERLHSCIVSNIALDDHLVRLADGSSMRFDKLILAMGASAFVPAIPGTERQGVYVFRSLDDAEALRRATANQGAKAVCIGGGILGLETAGALARRGVRVTLLESADWLLPRQLNRDAGLLLENLVKAQGISIKRSVRVSGISGDDAAHGVELEGGEHVEADFVVVTAGVRPNTKLAKDAGITVKQGIVVDDCLQTDHTDIFAVGDCAEHRGLVYGLWDPARFQGIIAGKNAAGIPTEFAGVPRANSLKVLDINLYSIGVVSIPDDSYVEWCHLTESTYVRYVFHGRKLVGAILIGDIHLAAAITKAIKSETDFSGILKKHSDVGAVSEFLESQYPGSN